MSTYDDPMRGPEPIAIIGLGCRFPGGVDSPDSYWALLRDGVDAIGDVPADRWDRDALYAADRARPGKTYVRRGGFLRDIDRFDAGFFGISPREAAHVDPQQRLLLEVAYEALESAGEPLEPLRGSPTGVFVGLFIHDYAHIQLADLERIDAYTGTGTAMSIAANRLSYLFDLRGPSVAVDTACSSSLVALHLACESLRSGETSMALAGGVNAILRPEMTVAMSKASMLSPDGRCHSFDARANGYVRAEGAGVVALKRLSDALRDGNPVRALILGTAANQDGRTKGISVPNGAAQQALVRQACARAGVDPSRIQYVEAHGTGTPVGDPIEANALGAALSEGRPDDRPCVIGSVKSNFGHTESASGIAGLIKVVLCLENRQIAPNLHFRQANPAIDFAALRLRVPVELEPWPAAEGPRLAGVNSFGFGGTNAHAVLAEAPAPAAGGRGGDDGPYLLPLSAADAAALREAGGRLRDHVLAGGAGGAALADLAYTAGARRTHHRERLALVARDRDELVERLDAFLAGQRRAGLSAGTANAEGPAEPAFLFTGMGPQWWAMGRQLLEREPVFREAVEECDRLFRELSGWSLLAELTRPEGESKIQETYVAQPAVFALQVGLLRLWASWGVRPRAVAGHSVGEIAAAYAAGALSLADAVKVIYHRSRLQHRTAGQGRMLAVGLGEAAAREAIAGREALVALAAINSPSSVTLAGDGAALEQIQRELEARQVFARFLKVPVPYHSPAMDPLRDELIDSLRDLSPRAATIPFYSTALGQRLEGPELGPVYWWHNVREPVLFAQTVDAMLVDGYDSFVEVGPHPALTPSVQECLAGRAGEVLPSLRRQADERASLLGTLGTLYARGCAVDWERVNGRRRVVPLPAYSWQRERYWDEGKESEARRRGLSHRAVATADGRKHALLGARLSLGRPTWTSEPEGLEFVRDHRVRGAVVYPGAAYLEMAIAAASSLSGDEPCELEDVRFDHALFWPEGEPLQFESVVTEGRLDISSRHGEARAWTRHMSGELRPRAAEGPPLDREALLGRLPEELTSGLVYPLFEDVGLSYGPSFRGIERVYRGGREALARVELPAHLRAEADQYALHPALLDACLHTLFCTLSIDGVDSDMRGDVYLPVRVRRFRFYRRPAGALWSHAVLRDRHLDRWFEGDVRIYDDDGALVAEALGLRCQNLNAAEGAAPDRLQRWLYDYVWEERPAGPAGGPAGEGELWIVYADARGAGERAARLLAERGRRVVSVRAGDRFERLDAQTFRVDPRRPEHARELLAALPAGAALAGVMHLWSLDVPPGDVLSADRLRETHALGYGSALHLAQALLGANGRTPPRLWLVTAGAQPVADGDEPHPARAPLWGLGRVLGNEQPELRPSLVDLSAEATPDEIERLVEEALAAGPEDELALRGRRRYAHRFARVERGEPTAARVRPDGGAYGLEIGRRGALDGLRLRERRRQAPGPGEVEIRVKAVGLNFKDVMKATGLLPDSVLEDNFWGHALGMECSGVVERVGAGVTDVREGDEVVAFARHAFRSHVVTDARLAGRKPAHLSFEEAATIPLAFGTAHYALNHLGRMRAGERVLIHAASGGVGQAAMMLARRAGAEIFATAGSDEKRAFAREAGAAHVMDSRSLAFEREVASATGGAGVDLVLNSLAGEAIDRSLRVLADYGRFLELGKLDIDKNRRLGMGVLHRNTSVHGVDLDRLLAQRPAEAGALLREVLELFEARALAPLPLRAFDAADVVDAFRHMAGAKHIGKVVVTLPEGEVAVERAGEVRFDEGATYVVTGGFGGFGLELLEWLAAHGARNLLVLSRSGASSEVARTALRAFAADGVRVHDERLDISDERALGQALAAARREMPPIKGVFHAAAVLDDGLARNQTLAQYERVAAPKLEGAWLLHRLTREDPLDHFVLFSSVTSVLGNQGSSNYVAANCFVDALAHHRRRVGLPALAVNWGLVANVGMATEEASIRRHLELNGLIALHTRLGLHQLGVEMQHGTTQITVAPVDWSRWLPFHQAAERPRFSRLAAEISAAKGPADAPQKGAALAERLAGAAPEARREIALGAVRERVAQVFGMAPEKVEVDKPFTALGLDSLMAIELRGKLEALGLTVSVAALLESATVGALADRALAALGHAASEGRAAPARPEREGRWVVVTKPNPTAALRLFCFPYAGGAPTVFHAWPEALPASFEVCAINLPGRARRISEAAQTSIAEMADAMIDELLPLLDRPFALFGHCMGSILMYEVARRLESQHGRSPLRLFVSGSMAPHLYQSPLVHEQDDPKFLEILKLLDFTNTRALLEDEEMRGLMLPTLRADFEAVATYGRDFEAAPPLAAPVTGFAGKKDLFAAPGSMTSWRGYTRSPFRLWMLDVHHYFVETHRAFLTRQIAADLAADLDYPGAAEAVRAAEQAPPEAEPVSLEGAPPAAPRKAPSAGRVRPLKVNPQAQLRLYCFPSALGREPAAGFAESDAADGLEIYLLEPPRQAAASGGLLAQAEALAERVAHHADDRPFAFFGHSTGAIVQYEAARYLRRHHGPLPSRLFTAASAAPHLYVMPNAHLLSDDKLVELLRVIGHPLAGALTDDAAARREMLPSLRADFERMAGYHYRPEPPLESPITALRGRGDLWAYFYGTEAWRLHTRGAFEVITLPGDHFCVERDPVPAVQAVARAFSNAGPPASSRSAAAE